MLYLKDEIEGEDRSGDLVVVGVVDTKFLFKKRPKPMKAFENLNSFEPPKSLVSVWCHGCKELFCNVGAEQSIQLKF